MRPLDALVREYEAVEDQAEREGRQDDTAAKTEGLQQGLCMTSQVAASEHARSVEADKDVRQPD